MKLRTIFFAVLIAGLVLLAFYLGRRSAQYAYNDMTNRFELITTYTSGQRNIVMLGNSMMAYGDWTVLTGRCDILNLGIGGLTVEDLHPQLPKVYSSRPQVCFIEVGINDIFRGVNYETYISGLASLVQSIQDKGIRAVLFHILYVSQGVPGYDELNKKVTRYNSGLDSLARDMKAEVLDMNALLAPGDIMPVEYVISDGLHLNDTAYGIWGQEIKNYLAAKGLKP